MAKETIAIIGSGNLGQAMAGHFALGGHLVSIQNRNHSKVERLRLAEALKTRPKIIQEFFSSAYPTINSGDECKLKVTKLKPDLSHGN